MRFRGERGVLDERHNTSGIQVGSPRQTALERSAIVSVLFVLLVVVLAWLLSHKRIAAQPVVHSAEIREEDDWEGILLMGPSIASFVWYSKDGQVTGGLLFVPGSAEDVDWIRVVCSSFSPEEAIELRAGLAKE